MSNTILTHPTANFPKSRIRRKPILTYRSPSAGDTDPPITPSTRYNAPNQSPRQVSAHTNATQSARDAEHHPRRKARTGSYSLPLYHPLGELALSLPPLNPTDFGLPLPNILGATAQGPSGRSRRLPANVRDTDEEGEVLIPTVSSIAAVAANEVKRASPRKRRVGGGNGKRKRRDGDDGDATYPAKRTRQTRAGGVDDNDFNDVQGQGDGDGPPEVDGPAERRPERRSTRSRLKPRGSSEAESVDGQPTQGSASPTEDNIKQSVEGVSEGASDEKEEGEVEER
ncbi:hypothetical protein P691DRAFT_808258 [Macrolepiota fuliginosa MF-IS2]|uniref:Uncharacterized protein n=1 Tax=Macrolepiota fuliginosa MF-IS2 TaxID=1400762 RepID=A0A9P6C7L0_9AGAR|nr:hypothetical protein P691DRAFT_808258 [Macrolepiota fuliginosa MF-IS2]